MSPSRTQKIEPRSVNEDKKKLQDVCENIRHDVNVRRRGKQESQTFCGKPEDTIPQSCLIDAIQVPRDVQHKLFTL